MDWTELSTSVVGMLAAALVLFGTRWGRALLRRSTVSADRKTPVRAAAAFSAVTLAGFVIANLIWPTPFGLMQIAEGLVLSFGIGAIMYLTLRFSSAPDGDPASDSESGAA